MEEEHTPSEPYSGDSAAPSPRPALDEVTYTTGQAARILKVGDRAIRGMIYRGELEAYQEEEGGRHRIPQRAVHAILDEQRQAAELPVPASERAGTLEVERLRERLETLQRDLGRFEGRLELAAKTEHALREEHDRLLAELEEERAERRRLQMRVEELSSSMWWWRQLTRPWWWRG